MRVVLVVVVGLLAWPGAAGAALPQQSGAVSLLDQANVTIKGAAVNDLAGISVAGAGDVNGDGRPDVIVGANNADANGADSGAAYVLLGFGVPALAYPRGIVGATGRAVAPLALSSLARTGVPSFSVSPALPRGLVLNPLTGTVSGTPTAGVDRASTVTTADLAGSAATSLAVAISDISKPSLSRKRFRVGKARTPITATVTKKKRTPTGTTFRYTLTAPSTVKILIERKLPGRKVKRSCKKQTKANRRKPRCTRYVRSGTLTRTHRRSGRKSVKFSGRIGKRKLKPGNYRATLTAKAPNGDVSTPRRLNFKIVNR